METIREVKTETIRTQRHRWKRPRPYRWTEGPIVDMPGQPSCCAYGKGQLLVFVSADEMDFRGEKRPQHMLSVSARSRLANSGGRRRATDAEIADVLRDFDMGGAEEDNHQPGYIRMFFLLADPRPGEEGVQCECKTDEQLVVEADGFRWSRTREFDPEKWPAWLTAHPAARLDGGKETP